jgi:hypothetical protein
MLNIPLINREAIASIQIMDTKVVDTSLTGYAMHTPGVGNASKQSEVLMSVSAVSPKNTKASKAPRN